MGYPKDYKYTKEHEWIHVNGNTATVGITDHAQESLGDIVFVELPKTSTGKVQKFRLREMAKELG